MSKDLQSDGFIAFLEKRGRTPSTIQAYLLDLEHFAEWFQRNAQMPLAPSLVDPNHLREYRQELERHRYTTDTVDSKIRAVLAWLKWAGPPEWNNPRLKWAFRGERAKVTSEHVKPRWLNEAELQAFFKAAEADVQASHIKRRDFAQAHERDAIIATFILHTGLTAYEAATLRRSDIHLRDDGGDIEVRKGSSRRSRRIPLNEVALKTLRGWLATRPISPSDYLWVSSQRSQVHVGPASIRQSVAAFGHSAGIEGLSPRVLRNTYAKGLKERGATAEEVANLLGLGRPDRVTAYLKSLG
jgi:site-specific recombinase XerD